MDKRFNVRVYGIWISGHKVLVSEEWVRGLNYTVTKFPGGGLDWGEGTLECLKREWKEELGLEIEVGDHFYTTDYFQKSAFDESQVISIYYMVQANESAPIVNLMEGERTFWVDLDTVTADTFTLAIDKKVGGMVHALFWSD